MEKTERLNGLDVFVYQRNITKDFLDELNHANYNELKKIFETVRYRFCGFLGFRRNVLRRKLGIGLVVAKDSYEYIKPLKEGDLILFWPNITIVSPTRLTIGLRVMRWGNANQSVPELTNLATYEMVMVGLQKGRPRKIPKQMLESIERFHQNQAELMKPLPRPEPLSPSRLP